MLVTRCEKVARRAADDCLRERKGGKPVSLYRLSVAADRAAREAGLKRAELYRDLSLYSRFLPAGSGLRWSRSGFLCAVNPYCPNPLPSDTPEGIMPGLFDDAVDMGPDAWSAKLRQGSVV